MGVERVKTKLSVSYVDHCLLQEGFENSRRLNGAVVMAVVGMRIYPGTSLWSRAVAEGVLPPETATRPGHDGNTVVVLELP